MLVAVDPDPISQGTLEDVLPSLLYSLHSVDPGWRVAVTSTALGDLAKTGYLAPTGADGGRWLSDEDLESPTIDWGQFPDAAPHGAIGATYLTATSDLYGFRRPEATLHFMIMSATDATPSSVITFADWATWVAEQGVVVSAATDDSDLAPVVAESGGVSTAPYGDFVWARTVGLIPAGAPLSYPLSRLPILGTVVVSVETPDGSRFEFFEAVGDPPVGDWEYIQSANAVAFLGYLPETGAIVLVQFEPAG